MLPGHHCCLLAPGGAQLSLLPRQGTPGPWGSGRGTENSAPMASADTEVGSACTIHTEEINPSLSGDSAP